MNMENTVTEEEDTSGTRRFRVRVKKCWDCFLNPPSFTASCLIAVVLGIALGFMLKFVGPLSEYNKELIYFPGELLMRMMEALIIPLIVISVMSTVSGLRVGPSRKVAVHAAVYFVSTTLLAVSLGLLLVLLIKPGVTHDVTKQDTKDESFFIADLLLTLAWSIIPPDMIGMFVQRHSVQRIVSKVAEDAHNFGLETNVTLVVERVEGTNVLGLIVWSFVFGLLFNSLGEEAEVLVETLNALNELIKDMIHQYIMRYLPFGLLFMIMSHVVEVEDWETTFELAKFTLVVVFGLMIYGTLVLPMIYFLCARRNPWAVIKEVFPALRTALVVSSSSATLPLTFQCCEERLKIDKRITRFWLPIGTNIHTCGTVFYEVVAVVFIAQLNNIHLTWDQLITIGLTSAVTSMGVAGIPAVGAVTTLFLWTTVGLPANEVGIVVVIEWLLDHCNTVINVMGNCIGVALIHQLSKRDLEDTEEQGQEMERMHGSDAEAQTPGEIQVQISSQASDDDTLNTLPNKTPFQNNEAEEPFQDEDQTKDDSVLEILCTPPVYTQTKTAMTTSMFSFSSE